MHSPIAIEDPKPKAKAKAKSKPDPSVPGAGEEVGDAATPKE